MQEKNDSTGGIEQLSSLQESSVQNNDVIDCTGELNIASNTTQKKELDLKKIEAEMLETQNSFYSVKKGKELDLSKVSSPSPQQAYSPFSPK